MKNFGRIVTVTLIFFVGSFEVAAKNKTQTRPNPLVLPWSGPYGGLPPFDKVKVSLFKEALEQGMAEGRRNIEVIANNPQSPDFENTIAALERAGEMLGRVMPIFEIWNGSLSSDEVKAVEKEMAPRIAAYGDEVVMNEKLFARIDAVYRSPNLAQLNAEQRRLVELFHIDFVSKGARLSAPLKAEVAQINQRLSVLSTEFGQNLLAEEADPFVIDDLKDLKGTPQNIIDEAALAAKQINLKSKWVVPNTRSSMEPFLAACPNRALREKAFRKWSSRGDNGNAHDNNKIVSEILKLRAQRSKILGFKTYADWHLSNTMAKKPSAALDLMMKVWKPAVAQVKKDVAEMQALIDAEKGGFKLEPWDYRFYAEKVRKAKFALDLEEVKPYLQLENVREAMFWVAGEIFGYHFDRVKNAAVFHPTMSVYRVTDAAKKVIGLWYFDPYMRVGKRSGAWMTSYRDQQQMDGKDVKAIVSNNSNFVQGKAGEPTTISWTDAVTMFHEFGHALHGLSSRVTYPTLSGTNVFRDYVEFPSQVNEKWFPTSQVMAFMKNKNGEVLPRSLVEKIGKAKFFNQGFDTVEFLASAIVDMKLHMAGDDTIDPRDFEKKTLAALGMPREIIMRHRIPHFGHLFVDEGYAAGYYGYLWAQVLDNDAFEAFTETGDPYNKEVAKKLYEYIFSKGNTIDPAEAFRLFRGRDAKVDALLRARGFPEG